MNRVSQAQLAKTRPPTRLAGAAFGLKRFLLTLRRHLAEALHPAKVFSKGTTVCGLATEKRTRLYSESDSAEVRLEMGKVQNLRLIARAIDGIEVPAGEVFSFWRQVGKCTRRRGFVTGRQLQEGCLIPAIGGGICQLTNSLYAAAIDAGLEIVERHPHTRVVPGAQGGKDATVAWNYIDLRFRGKQPFRIEATLTADELIVRIVTQSRTSRKELRQLDLRAGANSCATCGQEVCHHWHEVERDLSEGRMAFLIDQWWPEYVQLFDREDYRESILFRPLDGKRWKRPRYDCPVERFGSVRNFTLPALLRGLRQRRLAEQGAARQAALLDAAEELAQAYARALTFDVKHLVISQSLLPFLWRDGILGGRTFEVLMNRLPMSEIHARLDAVSARHPERKLLSDFRAPEELIQAEDQALKAVSRIFTCHAEIARGSERAVLLEWPSVSPMRWTSGSAIVFPGPTVARKGAYEVREAARRLDLEVILLGSELEGDDFWVGVKTRRAPRDSNWLEGVLGVVQPAVLEDRPIALLKALASGCPVIATAACGLADQPELTTIPRDDPHALINSISALESRAFPKADA